MVQKMPLPREMRLQGFEDWIDGRNYPGVDEMTLGGEIAQDAFLSKLLNQGKGCCVKRPVGLAVKKKHVTGGITEGAVIDADGGRFHFAFRENFSRMERTRALMNLRK